MTEKEFIYHYIIAKTVEHDREENTDFANSSFTLAEYSKDKRYSILAEWSEEAKVLWAFLETERPNM